LIAVSWVSVHTPLAGKPEMAEAWASAPAFSSLESIWAPMSIILAMAFV
jgi:hypothetical protein